MTSLLTPVYNRSGCVELTLLDTSLIVLVVLSQLGLTYLCVFLGGRAGLKA
jgi:hypothetical protein